MCTTFALASYFSQCELHPPLFPQCCIIYEKHISPIQYDYQHDLQLKNCNDRDSV